MERSDEMVVADDRDASQQIKDDERVQEEACQANERARAINARKKFMEEEDGHRTTHRPCARPRRSESRRETRKSSASCK